MSVLTANSIALYLFSRMIMNQLHKIDKKANETNKYSTVIIYIQIITVSENN